MIPQDRFIVVAKVPDRNVEGLRSLLRTMTFPEQTGFADPANSLVPFGEFETIHFARFAVLADNTLKDRDGYYPPSGCKENWSYSIGIISERRGIPNAWDR